MEISVVLLFIGLFALDRFLGIFTKHIFINDKRKWKTKRKLF